MTARRADAVANRSRLVEVARMTFAERGINAEMREIAERAEIGVGTIYRNFPSKDDLILAIISDALAEALASAETAEALPDARTGIRALLLENLANVERYGWLMDASLMGQLPERSREDILGKAKEYALVERYARLVRRAVAEGTASPSVDVELLAALLAAINAPWISKPLLAGRGAPKLAASIIETLLGPPPAV